MITVTVQPCLLGFGVSITQSGTIYWSPGLYETFGEVLWFLLNAPFEYEVILK